MNRKERVIVVGGGITGLTTAYALEKAAKDIEIVVLEGGTRLGGNIVTVHHQGFLLDGGPDSWVATKPYATDLAKELGLADELIETLPDNRKVYIVHEGRLHPMPEGVLLGIPTDVPAIMASELFTWDAKLRMGLELAVPRRDWHAGEDETVGAFLNRRFGDQLTDRLAGPLLGGIFAGEADHISVRAAFPQLVEAEKTHGSLIRAMRATLASRRAATKGKKLPSSFLSLKRGMADLVLNLAHRVAADVRVGAKVAAITSTDAGDPRGRFRVFAKGAGRLFADHVVFTGPAPAARIALASLDTDLDEAFAGFDYASTATVFLAWKRKDIDHPLDAAGYIVPRSAGRAALAATWVSSKWEHRAPSGQALLRVFFGGDGRDSWLALTDQELADLAEKELSAFLPLKGKPTFFKVFRYAGASPQPRLGHLDRMVKLKRILARTPGLYVVGNGYDGIGIPECIRQARETALAIHRSGAHLSPASFADLHADRGSLLPGSE